MFDNKKKSFYKSARCRNVSRFGKILRPRFKYNDTYGKKKIFNQILVKLIPLIHLLNQ